MDRFDNLQSLLKYHLINIFDAERQLTHALPIFANMTPNIELKKVFSEHLIETQMHQERILGIAHDLNISLKGKTCNIIKRLISQINHFFEKNCSLYKIDAGLIAYALGIERYEIASYRNLIRYAQALDYDFLAQNLQQNQAEEINTFGFLQKISLGISNKRPRKTI